MIVTINCVCPPRNGQARHASDKVTLPDVLDFRRTLTVRQTVAAEMGDATASLASVTGFLIEAYLLHCIDSWTLQDEKGKALPVTRQNVRDHLLTHYDEAEKVGDAADDLYTDKVVLPLLNRASSSSPDTSTPGSTSATNGSGTRRLKPSKRSSTSTTPTVVTGPMAALPAGASSS